MPAMSVINHRICAMNEVASKEDTVEGFPKLTEYAEAHPVIMRSVMRQYACTPDDRFGDTLIIFCSEVYHKKLLPEFKI